jgi:UDP-glucose 4-epimerase
MQTPVKNVLIIGSNSYIGTRFVSYADGQLRITTVDARGNHWQGVDFSAFDTVLFVAGIVHVKQKRHKKSLYYQVNSDLATQTATKAKLSNVKQFIYLSSMAVLTDNPRDFYGGSKKKAESELLKLSSPGFFICIVRPPMVYGPGCKGNFPKLVSLAKRTPLFPDINNKRSMIYIDNLCEFLRRAIIKNESGIFHPQNTEYVNITEMVLYIALLHGKKIRKTRLLNPLVCLLSKFIPSCNKLFTDFICEKNGDEAEYNVVDFKESLKICTNTSNG